MVDVDKFKHYNDSFGHPAGDEVLKTVGRLLNVNARDTDMAARFGGEEFAILLPHTDSQGALTVAERFRAAVEAGPWPQSAVTASFGVCTVLPGMRDPSELVDGADKALYAAKSGGRNRVAQAPPPLSADMPPPVHKKIVDTRLSQGV
jgi:diguanylate cyclase (GGDEF)-like protein